MRNDLNRIQKLYGEDFAKKFCRPYFSHLIEREDFSLTDLLKSMVAPSKYFYEDLIANNKEDEFRNAIWGILSENTEHKIDIEETPEQLMERAGYTLYKCSTTEDILQFKKYYAEGEEICTFDDPDRINTHTIFWAVKNGVDIIKREKNPSRQDNYGTSVISIQFTKGFESTLSIINRYNLSVEYGDATFSNDLEQIQLGLTDSFRKYYGIKLVKGRQPFSLSGYVADNNGVYHRCNCRINGTCYCDNNVVIINGEAKQFKTEQYVLADYYVFDRRSKTVKLLPESNIEDAFIDQFYDIKKIEVEIVGKGKVVKVFCGDDEPIEIILNKYGQIVSFKNNNISFIDNGFMQYSPAIEELKLNNVEHIGNDILQNNETLTSFEADKVKVIGHRAFAANTQMKQLKLNNVTHLGDFFLTCNEILTDYSAKKIKKVGVDYLFSNKNLTELIHPKLIEINRGFLSQNRKVTRFDAPLLDVDIYEKYLNKTLKQAKKENLITKAMQKVSTIKEDIFELL